MYIAHIFLLFLSSTYALYEDQIGKFDWRQQLIGCPATVEIERRPSTDRYLVGTAQNVIASISANSGKLIWRKVFKEADSSPQAHAAVFSLAQSSLCSVVESGRLVRIWGRKDGNFIGEAFLSSVPSPHAPVVATLGDLCFVVAHNQAHGISLTTGAKLWTVELKQSEWFSVRAHNDGVAIVGGSKELNEVHVKWIDAKGTQTLNRMLDVFTFDKERVVLSGSHLVGYADNTIYALDITANGVDMAVSVGKFAEDIVGLVPLHKDGVAAVRTSGPTYIVDLRNSFKQLVVLKSGSESVGDFSKNGETFFVSILNGAVSVTTLSKGAVVLKDLVYTRVSGLAPAKRVVVSGSEQALELLIIGDDCRLDHVVVEMRSSNAHVEWTREEGLASLSAVEMLDLPLSESQAAVENEFSEDEGNFIAAFIRRIISQLQQIKRWFSRTIEDLAELPKYLKFGPTSLSELFESLTDAANAAKLLKDQPLERDVFNLRKLIVATSTSGIIFALDNSNGFVVWRKYLGSGVKPFESISGRFVIPILVQRTTAFYNYDARVAVAYRKNDDTHLLFFNPMTGLDTHLETLDHVTAKRIEVLPFVGDDHLHSILVVDQFNQINLFPKLSSSALENQKPLYFMNIDKKTGKVAGYKINFEANKVIEVWTQNLVFPEDGFIHSVHGKPANQRTHSQGRVLIDRSVLYKYVNPNLMAVVIVGRKTPEIIIVLIDSVTGQTVHAARMQKASTPLHVVHCENWVTYAYWSEKGRRMEIGVLELFEGQTQQHVGTFDSEQPIDKPLHVEQSSFIFSQGIQAMSVSETEQGATNRAIILALPSGNLFEISRRVLDPLRPLELTQEMREEGGYFPYMPEIPVPMEDMLNYNQTVYHIRGIRTASSGLESTSLVLAYGLDLYYTRTTPSGTFDVLKDEFDRILISIVLTALIIGSIIARRLARNKALAQQWA